MIRLLLTLAALPVALFLVALGAAFAATVVGAPIGLALIATGLRLVGSDRGRRS